MVMVPLLITGGITFSSASENSMAATSEVISTPAEPPPNASKHTSKSTVPFGNEVGVRLFSNQLTVT